MNQRQKERKKKREKGKKTKIAFATGVNISLLKGNSSVQMTNDKISFLWCKNIQTKYSKSR
jgi:hypothetical protein